MKVLITGGGGFLGLRLARALRSGGKLGGKAISKITLLDGAFPADIGGFHVVEGDLADPQVLESAVEKDTAAVFHLAAVVSGAAEADFKLGMRVNLDGTRRLLERLRQCERAPRVIFTSSVAAFGGELPKVLDDDTTPRPQSSYGTQKVIGEYLISDFSRKGYIDGRSLRLPTIVVRAGKPNAAASSFASGIIREPLNGLVCECPVSADTELWLLSPRRALEAFAHAYEMPPEAWGTNRVVNLPGITASVAEMLAALKRVAGANDVVGRVAWKPDPRIQAIVQTWPARFRTPRALEMGFHADRDMDSVIRDYIADAAIKI